MEPTNLRSLCEELTEYVSLLDDPPHELVCRAQSFLKKEGCWLDDGLVNPDKHLPEGCWLDDGLVNPDEHLPDGCVIDDGEPHNCIYAAELVKQGKGKLDCKYWNAGRPLP